MIETPDNRKFFTKEENYISLLEFSRLFDAEMSIVKVKEAEVLDLQELAPAFCDAHYVQTPPVECQIIETKKNNKRQRIINNSVKINNYIEKAFKEKKVVSLKELRKTFNEVTLACLCNHLKKVRKSLENQGNVIIKVGGGKYKMI